MVKLATAEAAAQKKATRAALGATLAELADAGVPVVAVDADLTGSTTMKKLADAGYADRLFNCGIAEGNMMAVAAGAAAMGYTAFASSFAMFAAGRAFEQVRNSVGYTGLNVKIGASHGGISVGEDGASHQCLEDFTLMRAIPGMVVMSPADAVEAKAMVKAAYEHEGPVYMRFGRSPVPVFHDEDSFTFTIGKGEVMRDGTDVAIIANGLLVAEAVEAGKLLADKGISARIINMATIKPLDGEVVLKAARECGRIVTCEEHSIIGGLGEAVCSLLSEKLPTPVKRIGVNDVFGHSGPAAALLEEFGLCASNIAKVAEEFAKG